MGMRFGFFDCFVVLIFKVKKIKEHNKVHLQFKTENLITRLVQSQKKITITYFGGPWLKTIGITANKKSHFLGWKG